MPLQRMLRGGEDERVYSLPNPRCFSLSRMDAYLGTGEGHVSNLAVVLDLPELQPTCDPPHQGLRSLWQPKLIIFHGGSVSSQSC